MVKDSYRDLEVELGSEVRARFVLSDATGFLKGDSVSLLPGDIPLKTKKQTHSASGDWVNFQSPKNEGDWIATECPQLAVGVFVADCTALLVSGKKEGRAFVAAIHAGWRGTAKKIIESFFDQEGIDRKSCRAWLSPSISKKNYEVSESILKDFENDEAETFFEPTRPGHGLFDLKAFQEFILKKEEIAFESSELCSFNEKDLFSYRRAKGELTARHLAWCHLI